jgi:thioredoxin 1/thioredoxin 2
MTYTELTLDNYKTVMTESEMLIIQFREPDSEMCTKLAKVVDNVAKEHSDIVFARADIDKHSEFMRIFAIKEVPAMAMVKEGIMVYKEEVMLAEEDLNYVIGKCREINMDDIRKELKA